MGIAACRVETASMPRRLLLRLATRLSAFYAAANPLVGTQSRRGLLRLWRRARYGAAGALYAAYGGRAYLAMAALSAAGLLGTVCLRPARSR
jgi:hypothetical protein